MKKLIKLSDTHYIVVDDSEIKEKSEDWFYSFETNRIYDCKTYLSTISCEKITHSTQPLEVITSLPDTGNGEVTELNYDKIKPLLLSEVEEAIYGYNVEKMAHEYLQKWRSINNSHLSNPIHAERCKNDYKAGFKAATELQKDKLFTVRDIEKAIIFGFEYNHKTLYNLDVKDFIQSLRPKTEWEVEIVDGKINVI